MNMKLKLALLVLLVLLPTADGIVFCIIGCVVGGAVLTAIGAGSCGGSSGGSSSSSSTPKRIRAVSLKGDALKAAIARFESLEKLGKKQTNPVEAKDDKFYGFIYKLQVETNDRKCFFSNPDEATKRRSLIERKNNSTYKEYVLTDYTTCTMSTIETESHGIEIFLQSLKGNVTMKCRNRRKYKPEMVVFCSAIKYWIDEMNKGKKGPTSQKQSQKFTDFMAKQKQTRKQSKPRLRRAQTIDRAVSKKDYATFKKLGTRQQARSKYRTVDDLPSNRRSGRVVGVEARSDKPNVPKPGSYSGSQKPPRARSFRQKSAADRLNNSSSTPSFAGTRRKSYPNKSRCQKPQERTGRNQPQRMQQNSRRTYEPKPRGAPLNGGRRASLPNNNNFRNRNGIRRQSLPHNRRKR